MAYEPPDTEAAMVEVVQSLRADPEKYETLRAELSRADSDEQRVSTLVKFATSEQDLAALMPARAAEQTELMWTTVTVTTVFILEGSAY